MKNFILTRKQVKILTKFKAGVIFELINLPTEIKKP